MTAPTPDTDPEPVPENPRPYGHLTVDELRQVPDLSDDEWIDELRVRGVIVPAYDGPPEELKPIAYLPGAVERFLKERG